MGDETMDTDLYQRTIGGMMKAVEVEKATRTKLYSRPVFIDGIMQRTLHKLLYPVDARVNGIVLRLPAGCVICLLGGGSGGTFGSLGCDVEFLALNGQTYRATQGMSLVIPT